MSIAAIRAFNSELNALLSLLRDNSRTDAQCALVLSIESKLKIIRAGNAGFIVLQTIPHLFKYNDLINSRDDAQLLGADYTHEIAGASAEDQSFFLSLLGAVRDVHSRANATLRARAWDHLMRLRDAAFEWHVNATPAELAAANVGKA